MKSRGSAFVTNTTRPWVDDSTVALFTDLYELTMMQAYHAEGMTDEAIFSLFVRRLPRTRNYLLACGIGAAVDYLERLCFSDQDIDCIASLGQFNDDFLSWLRSFRFTGTVRAVAEGMPVFANEPILEIRAPIAEAQVVETFVMNQINVATILATKASRMVVAAEGRPVVDFAPRRMHGTDAAIKGAHAFAVAGIQATSNVLAGMIHGVPVTGTMAHSFIQAHDSEMDAFRAFNRLYPGTVLLVDTYDTLAGVRKVVTLAKELGEAAKVRAIRLDSGDLHALSVAARKILDEGGLGHVNIFASGGLDEHIIADLIARGAPIDGFGVGTSLGVSDDAPGLDIAYKLCAYAGKGRLKLSKGKPILPGSKQVFRRIENGRARGDVIARDGESLAGTPLLLPVMKDGKRIPGALPDLAHAHEHARKALGQLPEEIRAIRPVRTPYPVTISPALEVYQAEVARTVCS